MYKGDIEENDAKIISRQLLEGLQIMHKKGFTHRDLKPNVILRLLLYDVLQQIITIFITFYESRHGLTFA
jgi:serine/threonine protein kinase